MDIKELEKNADNALIEAYKNGDYKSDLAMNACRLHQDWLKKLHPAYSQGAHLALARAYMSDPNLKSKFDSKFEEGTAEFFLEALKNYFA